jgi:beta-phosphoglucomutase-like phosphatase (HAD superfamily)
VDAALLEAIGRADTTIWDFDGVLADTEPLQMRAYRLMLGEDGDVLDDATFAGLIGRKELEIWQHLWGLGVRPRVALDELVEQRADLFLALCEQESLHPDGRIRRLIASARGERIVLSSGRERVIQSLLVRWGLDGDFAAVHALADQSEPKTEALRRLVEVRRQASSGWRGAIVEDSPAMLAHAAELGLVTVAVAHALNDHEALARADFVLPATLEA